MKTYPTEELESDFSAACKELAHARRMVKLSNTKAHRADLLEARNTHAAAAEALRGSIPDDKETEDETLLDTVEHLLAIGRMGLLRIKGRTPGEWLTADERDELDTLETLSQMVDDLKGTK